MNFTFKNFKIELKYNLILFTLILFFCIPLSACKETKPTNTEIPKTKTMQDDKEQLKNIIAQLNSDYSSIMGMYDLDMEIFTTDKSQYISNYTAVLSKMDYLDNSFRDKLIKKLTNNKVTSKTPNLRPYIDPLFEAEYAAEKIQIHGFDIEDNMAAVSVQLYDSFDKILSSFSQLFFDKNENGKWMLSGHDISESVRNTFPNTISPDKFVGLYTRDKISYSLKKSDGKFILEYCTTDCTKVGTLKEVQIIKDFTYSFIMENISGEIIPTYVLSDGILDVFEYNTETDKWENNKYTLSQSQG